jgi:hypothetical protein
MLLWEPPSDSLVHITNHSDPVCEGSHSTARHLAISVLVVAFLAVVITANVPVPGFQDHARKIDDPVLNALGPRQSWDVFAPNPPGVTSAVAVRFTYKDGTRSQWAIRRGGALFHAYRDYRWLKLAERVAGSPQAAVALLQWAAQHRAESKPLARADLVRTVQPIAPVGKPKSDRPPPTTAVLYSLRSGT